MTQRKVRVRFAPSPTGALHIGGVRTALYNYLFAKQNGGDLILRIEDTDSQRFVPGAEAYIIEALTWLGIKFDEGVGFGGEYGPYRQSERRDIYKKYVDQLLDAGCAYIAFDTPEELDAKRKEIPNFQYDASTRMQMRNSLTLSEEEVKSLIDAGNQYVVRVKIEPDEDIHVNDLIRGEVIINSSILDDKVLYKSADQLPTYHLANIVDDHLMEVTHVIRGEEWLPSAPLHVLLYRYFGWEDTMPRFAHLALLLKPEGNGKLSKRDGDRLGFPVFPLEWHDPKSGEVSSGYRESGYLPEAVVNFLALLGWNPGNDQEVMSMDELIHSFDLSRCSKSGAKFDYEKGKWFNHHYIQAMDNKEAAALFMPILESHGVKIEYGMDVKNVVIEKENGKRVAKQIVYVKDGQEQTIDLIEDDLVFITNGCCTDTSCYGDQTHAPDLSKVKNGAGESWDMWKAIAAQAKHGEFGNPDTFCSDVDATNWMSATVATSNEEIIQHIMNVCKRDPRSGKVTTGGIVTVKDSTDNWYLSWTINRQPQFKSQDKNMVLVWLYSLNTNREGNYVKKAMRDCTGEEVCREWLYHIGVPEDRIAALAHDACNTTTCFMPYINAFFQPRKESDRPKVVPDGAVNFAFIGQFAETPRDTIFTTEYSMRTGMESVYTLLNVDRGVPEVWGSKYDVRELLRACYYAIDKKPITDVKLSFMEKQLLHTVMKKVKGTDVELLLKESGLIE